jgi:hypothetical protein
MAEGSDLQGLRAAGHTAFDDRRLAKEANLKIE